jgi:hypothetical protein
VFHFSIPGRPPKNCLCRQSLLLIRAAICCEHLIVLLYPARITTDLSFPALNTTGAKVEDMVKVENKTKVENKSEMEKKTHAEHTMIKVDQDGMPIHRCDMKVKVE